jgi:pyrimidine 5'-nucleotidase
MHHNHVHQPVTTMADIVVFVSTTIISLFYIRWKNNKHIDLDKTINNDEFYDCRMDDGSIMNDDLTLYESLLNRTSLNANELICHVSSTNEVLPNGILRSDMRLHNLWHRATYVLIIHTDEGNKSYIKESNIVQSLDDTYVLVQRRSSLKDYCPLKLDPLPGGVVGYNESYYDNAKRELYEEMGIQVSSTSLQRLFTFPYEDERVRVWGEFYICFYEGKIDDLILQKEEVDSVRRMSLSDLKHSIQATPMDYMPDACYAMKLYFQRLTDQHVKRRLLKGYSSSNLDAYTLRPKPRVIFFDCDDCLYFDQWKTANQLTKKIDDWCTNHGLPSGKAYELYKQYGTALRGLLAEGYIEHTEQAIDQFLHEVHDIPVHDLIQPDVKLRNILLQVDPTIPKYIFTASVREHAVRCINALGIADLFVDVIDCKACNFETKHSQKAFQIAMKIAGIDIESDPTTFTYESCLFLDDNVKNIQAGREIGWRCILVGTIGRDCGTNVSSEHAEHEIDHIHHLPHVLPELFK